MVIIRSPRHFIWLHSWEDSLTMAITVSTLPWTLKSDGMNITALQRLAWWSDDSSSECSFMSSVIFCTLELGAKLTAKHALKKTHKLTINPWEKLYFFLYIHKRWGKRKANKILCDFRTLCAKEMTWEQDVTMCHCLWVKSRWPVSYSCPSIG